MAKDIINKASDSDKKMNLLKNSGYNKDVIKELEGLKPFQETIKVIMKEREAALQPFLKMSNELKENTSRITKQFKETIISTLPISNLIYSIPKLNVDLDKLKINYYKVFFKEFSDVVNLLFENTIFPPINFCIEKSEEIINLEKSDDLIYNKDLKIFYLDKIEEWKNKYKDENSKKIIDEVKFNFENDNSYSVFLLISMLIEYMLNQSFSDKLKNTKRYPTIREILYDEVFKPIGIEKLHEKFIENNLYKNTDKAEEFSRHMTHGHKIEFGNMKSAINMVFIYDFIQDTINVKQ